MPRGIRIAPEVRDALASGGAVVALETAAVTHGLPREPLATLPPYLLDPETPAAVRAAFGGGIAANRALGHALAAAVRAEGAVPATVGMLRGELVIGLTSAELDELAAMRDARKLSAREIPLAAARGESGGTTVAGTLLACARAEPAPIRVFATGGIGGVHRGWTGRPDVSADLQAIARHRVCVVSAGAKSILDLPATLEALDTLGVPTLGFGTPHFPRFLTRGDASLPVREVPASAAEVARILDLHWTAPPRGLGRAQGVLLCVDPPEEHALPLDEIEPIIAAEVEHARERGIAADRVTPALLAAIASRSAGRSVEANVAALLQNASVAAAIAVAHAKSRHAGHDSP
jgi:pseudouridine-5'-phosphate glycosidase